jgi:hypothetical protein
VTPQELHQEKMGSNISLCWFSHVSKAPEEMRGSLVSRCWAWLGLVHVDRSLSHFSIGYVVSCKCLDFGMTSRYYSYNPSHLHNTYLRSTQTRVFIGYNFTSSPSAQRRNLRSMGTFLNGMVSMLDLESGPSPPCSVHAAVIHSMISWNRC